MAPDGFYTDDKGRVRPISKSKGKGGAAAVAVAVAVAVGAGGTAGVAGTSAVGGSGSAGSAKSSSRVRDRDSLNAVLRLERKGLRVTSRLTSDDDDCVTHSHGQVQDFFREQPCAALFRALIEVRDKRRSVVLVAIAWVDMPASSGARQLKELVDVNGTGNVTALSQERGRYRHVRFTGEYYESVREATTVVNAQAQPVGRSAGTVALAEIVASAVR